jgi:hypothetical protein
LTRVPVDADGGFHFSLPIDAGECALELEGDWLFVDPPQRVAVDEPNDVVVLRPQVGARMRVVVQAAPGGHDYSAFAVKGECEFAGLTSLLESWEWAEPSRAVSFVVGEPFEVGPVSSDAQRAQVRVDGFGSFAYESPRLTRGVVNDVVISLPARAWLSGRVRDVYGAAVPDVDLDLRPAAPATGARLTAKSGPDGRFDFFGAPVSAPLVLRVHSSEHLPAPDSRLDALEVGQRIDNIEVVLDLGGVLAGRVLRSSGEPAAFASVRAEPLERGQRGARGSPRATRCDSDGRFHLSRLRAGPQCVTVEWAPESADAASEKACFERVELGGDLVLVLEPTEVYAGRVVDQRGAPVRDFDVHARLVRRAGTTVPTSRMNATAHGRDADRAGEFELTELLAGEWSIEVRAPGYEPVAPRVVVLPRDAGALNFQLVRQAAIRGVTVDGVGAPVGRIVIRARSARGDRSLRLVGVSDRAGAFADLFVASGPVELIARGHGYELERPLELQLAPGEEREVRLVLVKR